MKAIKNYFLYSLDFVGVCGRKEFWTVFPIVIALYVGAVFLLFLNVVAQIIALIIGLALMLPTLSIIVRRLHDTDRSAKFLLWWLLPFIGVIVVLIFLTEKTKYVI